MGELACRRLSVWAVSWGKPRTYVTQGLGSLFRCRRHTPCRPFALSPTRRFVVSLFFWPFLAVICHVSFSGDAGGGWGCLQAFDADFDFHGLIAGSFKSSAHWGGIAGISPEGNGDMLFSAPTVIGWI